MSVPEGTTRFLGLDPSGTLHQDAGDDLQAVSDAVLNLLQEDLLTDEIVLELEVGPLLGDVGNGEQ